MKTKFTQEELEQMANGAFKAFDQVCLDIEKNLETELEIVDEDRDDETKDEVIMYLKQYLFPWNGYESRMDALDWLKENNFIV